MHVNPIQTFVRMYSIWLGTLIHDHEPLHFPNLFLINTALEHLYVIGKSFFASAKAALSPGQSLVQKKNNKNPTDNDNKRQKTKRKNSTLAEPEEGIATVDNSRWARDKRDNKNYHEETVDTLDAGPSVLLHLNSGIYMYIFLSW